MNSVEKLAEPIPYITRTMSAHSFFEFVSSEGILLVWCLRIPNPFPRLNFDAWVGEIYQ